MVKKVKNKSRRNKKFWTGIMFILVGSLTLLFSYVGFMMFPDGSWFRSMQEEIGGIGLPLLIGGVILVLFNKNIVKELS